MGLTNLQEISLSKNNLQSLHKETFQGLTNLKSIHLYSNILESIHGEAFKGLKNLQEISLASNCLQCIPKETFKGLKKLEKIWLNNNKLNDKIKLELNIEESVKFVTYKSGQSENVTSNDIELIIKK